MFPTILAVVALLASVLGSPVPTTPVTIADAPGIPSLTADRWISYDATSDVVLASWNANDRAPMASVTKVMTAMVVLENADLSTQVSVPAFATETRGSRAGLIAGERWNVGDLLLAMMIRSGNDAALTLAYHVGGESTANFISKMNAKAASLGMVNTHFENPHGLDAEDHYSTARDLLTLTVASQDYPDILRIARTRVVTMPTAPNGDERTWSNTNALLGTYPGVTGLKTGDTPWADKVLLATSDRAGRRIYTVVMHSDNHFADTRELLDWSYSTYSIRDRWLASAYREEGGGGSSPIGIDPSDSEERRLRAMRPLDDGKWRTSSLEDLPKAATIGRWIREAIPNVASGD